MTLFFGQRWDAPLVDDAEQVPTPVGRACLRCLEVVVDGDRGLFRVVVDGPRQARVEPIHAECDLIGVEGHTMGVCHCTGYDATSRDAARLVWRRVGEARGRPLEVRADEQVKVDVYAVGWLSSLQSAWRHLTVPDTFGVYHRRYWWRNLRRTWRYCVGQARQGNWRAVRMTFNGYMCEPTPFPAGVARCGTGWTRVRARRSLDRQVRKAAARKDRETAASRNSLRKPL